MSSIPADSKKLKRGRTFGPDDLCEIETKKADIRAAEAITSAAGKISDAADKIVNCLNDLKPALQALANRNHREIMQTSSAVKQLVCFFL